MQNKSIKNFRKMGLISHISWLITTTNHWFLSFVLWELNFLCLHVYLSFNKNMLIHACLSIITSSFISRSASQNVTFFFFFLCVCVCVYLSCFVSVRYVHIKFIRLREPPPTINFSRCDWTLISILVKSYFKLDITLRLPILI